MSSKVYYSEEIHVITDDNPVNRIGLRVITADEQVIVDLGPDSKKVYVIGLTLVMAALTEEGQAKLLNAMFEAGMADVPANGAIIGLEKEEM